MRGKLPVNDDRTYVLLEDIARRENRSLLQYVRDSFPWTTPDERQVLAQIQAMTAEEQQGVAELVQFLISRRRPPPYLGTFPVSFTGLSFVSLDHLIPMLTAYERKELEKLQGEINEITDPAAKELVQRIMANKTRHLETLQSLAAAHSQQAVA
jgi:rubrerythrin